MHVLIDTNIYLNFYQLSKDYLDSLESLVELVTNKDVSLIIPKQVKDEFLRKKISVQADYKKYLKIHTAMPVKIPDFLKFNKYTEELMNAYEKLQKSRNKFIKEYETEISNPKSQINSLLERLFNLAKTPEESIEVLQRAHYRTVKGNPPRKNNSNFGDAIIWETILIYYAYDDLVIVSGDGDFASENNKEKIDEFLETEFNSKNSHKVELFTTLGSFISSRQPKNKAIKKEIIAAEKNAMTTGVGRAKIQLGLSHAMGFNLQEGTGYIFANV